MGSLIEECSGATAIVSLPTAVYRIRRRHMSAPTEMNHLPFYHRMQRSGTVYFSATKRTECRSNSSVSSKEGGGVAERSMHVRNNNKVKYATTRPGRTKFEFASSALTTACLRAPDIFFSSLHNPLVYLFPAYPPKALQHPHTTSVAYPLSPHGPATLFPPPDPRRPR